MTNYIAQISLPNGDVALIEDSEARSSVSSMQTQLDGKANASDVYTKTEIDNMIGNIETLLSQV